MPKSNSSGAVFFRRLSIFGVDLLMHSWRKHLLRGSKVSLVAEGPVCSRDPSSDFDSSFNSDPERAAANIFFLRALCKGEWSLSTVRSLFRPQEMEVVRCSLSVTSRDGGDTHCSTTIQFGAGAGETWDIGALPRSRVFVWTGVLALSEVMAFSGVRVCSRVLDRSDVLTLSGIGDWARPELADISVLFLWTWDEPVLSRTGIFSWFGTLPDSRGFGFRLVDWVRHLLKFILFPCLWHFDTRAQILNLLRIPPSGILPVKSYGIPTNRLVIRKTTQHSFSQQCRSRKWLGGEEISLKDSLSQRVWFRNRFPITVRNPM